MITFRAFLDGIQLSHSDVKQLSFAKSEDGAWETPDRKVVVDDDSCPRGFKIFPCNAKQPGRGTGQRWSHVCMLSHFGQVQLYVTIWTVALHPPGSSVHGILQAGRLEWVALPLFGRFQTLGCKPCLLRLLHWKADAFTTSATWEVPEVKRLEWNPTSTENSTRLILLS